MNKERRKAIETLQTQLQELRGKVEDIRSELESLKDEEQDYYDNMPESFQNGEKGELAQAAIDALESAVSNCESIDTEFGEADDYLGTAQE